MIAVGFWGSWRELSIPGFCQQRLTGCFVGCKRDRDVLVARCSDRQWRRGEAHGIVACARAPHATASRMSMVRHRWCAVEPAGATRHARGGLRGGVACVADVRRSHRCSLKKPARVERSACAHSTVLMTAHEAGDARPRGRRPCAAGRHLLLGLAGCLRDGHDPGLGTRAAVILFGVVPESPGTVRNLELEAEVA